MNSNSNFIFDTLHTINVFWDRDYRELHIGVSDKTIILIFSNINFYKNDLRRGSMCIVIVLESIGLLVRLIYFLDKMLRVSN